MSKFFKQKNSGFTHTLTFTKQLCCAPLAHCKSKCRGFTLVETLVAISIFTVSILGLLSVLSQGISDTGYAKKKVAAGYLAQEGIECIRNTRDNYFLYPDLNQDWSKFVALDVKNITCPTIDSGFARVLGKTLVNLNEVRITSEVDWTQGSGNYNITFSENLFNWVE